MCAKHELGAGQPVQFRVATERPQVRILSSSSSSYSALAEDENEHDDEDDF